MKRLKRTQFGNPILRRKARLVSLSSLRKPTFKKLVRQMFFTMRQAQGIGLAAPQVGESLQLAVIEIKKSKIRPHVKSFPPTAIVNPKIVSTSKKQTYDWEGCLSLPGVRGLVPRHESVTARYYDEVGKKKKLNLRGFQARVFQHEIDHLKGILYIDRMSNMESLMTTGEFKKRILKKGLKSK